MTGLLLVMLMASFPPVSSDSPKALTHPDGSPPRPNSVLALGDPTALSLQRCTLNAS